MKLFEASISLLRSHRPSLSAKGDGVFLEVLEFEVGFLQTRRTDSKTYKTEQLEQIVQSSFSFPFPPLLSSFLYIFLVAISFFNSVLILRIFLLYDPQIRICLLTP